MVAGPMRAWLFALLIVPACGAALAAGPLDTTEFVAACTTDPVVLDEPGLQEGSPVTPQIYCECVAGKFAGGGLRQSDVDMLVKLHRDEITDEDAESYPTLEELIRANEAMEDECKESLGMPAAEDDGGEEGPPLDEEDIPLDE